MWHFLPFLAIFGHFLSFFVGQIMVLLGINLGFFRDEKSFKTSFKMNKQSPVPFLCHRAVFLLGHYIMTLSDHQFRGFRIIEQSPAHVPFLFHQMAQSDHFDNCSYDQFQDD